MVPVNHHIAIVELGKTNGFAFLHLSLFMTAKTHLAEEFTFGQQVQMVVREAEALLQGMVAQKQGAGRKSFLPKVKRRFQQGDGLAVFCKEFCEIFRMPAGSAADDDGIALSLPEQDLINQRGDEAAGAPLGSHLLLEQTVAGGCYAYAFTGLLAEIRADHAGIRADTFPHPFLIREREEMGAGPLPSFPLPSENWLLSVPRPAVRSVGRNRGRR